MNPRFMHHLCRWLKIPMQPFSSITPSNYEPSVHAPSLPMAEDTNAALLSITPSNCEPSVHAPSLPMAEDTSAALSSITPSTHISGPFVHAPAEQLATRRMLKSKQRSASHTAGASTTGVTTPESLSNLFAGWQGLGVGERPGGGRRGESRGEGGGEGGRATAVPLATPLTNPSVSLAASITPSATMTPSAVSAAIARASMAAVSWSSSHPATRNGKHLTKPPTTPLEKLQTPLEKLLSLRADKATNMKQSLYSDKMASLRERVGVLENIRMCVVCLENPKNVVISPCNHLCVCQHCSTLIPRKCPICRGVVESKIVVYV